MLLRIAMMRNELQRQRKALSREIDLRQKERTQFQKKGKLSTDRIQIGKGSSKDFSAFDLWFHPTVWYV